MLEVQLNPLSAHPLERVPTHRQTHRQTDTQTDLLNRIHSIACWVVEVHVLEVQLNPLSAHPLERVPTHRQTHRQTDRQTDLLNRIHSIACWVVEVHVLEVQLNPLSAHPLERVPTHDVSRVGLGVERTLYRAILPVDTSNHVIALEFWKTQRRTLSMSISYTYKIRQDLHN